MSASPISESQPMPPDAAAGGNEVFAFLVTPFIAGSLWGIYMSTLLLVIDGWDPRETAVFLIGGGVIGWSTAAIWWNIADRPQRQPGETVEGAAGRRR